MYVRIHRHKPSLSSGLRKKGNYHTYRAADDSSWRIRRTPAMYVHIHRHKPSLSSGLRKKGNYHTYKAGDDSSWRMRRTLASRPYCRVLYCAAAGPNTRELGVGARGPYWLVIILPSYCVVLGDACYFVLDMETVCPWPST